MKRTLQKRLSLLLAAAMIAVLFAGCGETASESTAPAESSASVQEAPETTVPQEAAPASEEVASQKEETATEPELSETAYPLVEETATLTAYAPIRTENNAVVNGIQDFEAVQLAEEITNVHVEWDSIPEAQYSELCPIMIASGDYADLIYSLNQGYSLTKAFGEEVIIDMANYMAEYAPNYSARLDSIPHGWNYASTDAGNVLAFYSLNSSSNQQGVLIRGDWLKELDLETPETMEDFVDMLYAFKDNYGGTPLQMSSASQEGLIFTGAYDIPGYQISIFGSGSYWYQGNGVVKNSLIEDGYKEVLTLMNQLYNDEIFSRDFNSLSPGTNDATKNGMVSNGTVGVVGANDSMVDFYADLLSDTEGAYFVAAKNPTLKAGDVVHFGNMDEVSAGSTMASISVQCKNVELAVQYLDFWYSEEGVMAFNYGIEGKTYTIEDGVPVYTDIIENNEWGLGYTSAINTYCPIGNIASYANIRRFNQYYSDLSLEAIDLWGNDTDLAYVMPKVTLTDEETEVYNANTPDIETYAQECILSFITGAKDINTEWDAYVDTLKSMGIEENTEIYQAAFDRMS